MNFVLSRILHHTSASAINIQQGTIFINNPTLTILLYSKICSMGPSWSYGSWIYNHLCNRCLSPLTLWVPIPLSRGVLDTTLCDKVCQGIAVGLCFFPGYSGFLHQ